MNGEVGFRTGERVMTPHGPGKVQYCRMEAPDFVKVACYSVMLDHKLKASQEPPFPFYNGTIVPAEQVQAEE